MKRVVYIESRPDHGIWEKLVEMEDDEIVFETPWKPSLMSNSVKTPK